VNVQFVKYPYVNGEIAARIFERGVGETLACGTGIIAAAMFLSDITGADSPIEIISKSGKKFIINFRKNLANFKDVSLRSHAQIIFNGYINLRSINE
jgi:diaminopimelate epimerase